MFYLLIGAFSGGVSSIILLYRIFTTKSEFEKLKEDFEKSEKNILDMKRDYVTHQTLELMLARITDQLSHISDSLKSLTKKGYNGGNNE